MAKNATSIIIDLTPSMLTPLVEGNFPPAFGAIQIAQEIVMNQIKGQTERTRDVVSVVLLGCDQTENAFDDEDDFEHISYLHKPVKADIAMIESIADLNVSSKLENSHNADLYSAIRVGAGSLKDFVRHLKYTMRLWIITDGKSDFSKNSRTDVASFLIENEIRSNFIILNDEVDAGFSAPDSGAPLSNLQHLQHFSNQINIKAGSPLSTLLPVSDAKDLLSRLTLPKPPRSFASINFQIGKNIQIPIKVYSQTKKVTIPTLTKGSKLAPEPTSTKAIREVSYYVIDSEGNPQNAEKSTIQKSYRFGKDSVTFSLDHEDVIRNQTQTDAGFTLLGIVSRDQIHPGLNMGTMSFIAADPKSKKNPQSEEAAISAFNSFVYTLADADYVGIASFKTRSTSELKLAALLPQIKHQSIGLLVMHLPFHEDIRRNDFSDLPNIQPTIEQSVAMESFLLGCDLDKNTETNYDESLVSSKSLDQLRNEYLQSFPTHRKINFNNITSDTTLDTVPWIAASPEDEDDNDPPERFADAAPLDDNMPLESDADEDDGEFDDNGSEEEEEEEEEAQSDDDEEEEVDPPVPHQNIYYPPLHYFYSIIKHRLLTKDDDSMPVPADDLVKMFEMPGYIKESDEFKQAGSKVKAAFPFQVVEGKKKSSGRSWVPPGGHIDEDAIMAGETAALQPVKLSGWGFDTKAPVTFATTSDQITDIGYDTPSDDFIALFSKKISTAERLRWMSVLLSRIIHIIGQKQVDWINKSINSVKVLREQAIEHSLPNNFNSILQELFSRYRNVNGITIETPFWLSLISRGIAPISQSEHSESKTSPEDAKVFLATKGDSLAKQLSLEEEEDDDDGEF